MCGSCAQEQSACVEGGASEASMQAGGEPVAAICETHPWHPYLNTHRHIPGDVRMWNPSLWQQFKRSNPLRMPRDSLTLKSKSKTSPSKLSKGLQLQYIVPKLKLPKELLIQFYRGIIESVICTSITVWFGSATQQEKHRLQRIIRTAEETIATNLPSIEDLYTARIKKRAVKIFTDPSHPGHKLFQPLPSKRRYRALHTRKTRHKNSFFPKAITLLNK
ncbi:uncharacterized protein LOC131202067 [Ahaetulla prasina]|uniref:uncharacterized protein LOC131202067 n=1 Tax=Ahaetulla prasina TaxID=499056 RepID=UPI00264A0D49|nr:uncharacterized protein LOC131202067 [Ahaetulla prasina]